MSKVSKNIKILLAVFLSAVIGIGVYLGVKTHAERAANFEISSDKSYMYFTNTVPHAKAGNIIINPLGYFVTVYTTTDGKNYTAMDTVFCNVGATMGRSGYNTINSKTKSKFGDGQTETRIYFDDCNGTTGLYTTIKMRSNASNPDAIVQHVKDMLAGKASGKIVVDSLITTARLEGSGYKEQSGWSNTTSGMSTNIAYTQIRLKNKNPATSDILHDLGVLNGNYTYSKAVSKNSSLYALQVNPQHCVGNWKDISILSATNGTDGITSYPNLNATSLTRHFSSATQRSVTASGKECYGLTTKTFYAPPTTSSGPSSSPSSPSSTPTPYNIGGDIKTAVTGYGESLVNNFKATSVLYSGQLGYFNYNYKNAAYRITHAGKYYPVGDDGKKAKKPEAFIWDEIPAFHAYGTAFSEKSAHNELDSSTLTSDKYPSAETQKTFDLISRSGLLDRDHDKIEAPQENDFNSSKFRINYNTYDNYDNSNHKVVSGRATMWASKDNSTYADSLTNVQIVPSDVEAYDITLEDADTGEEVDYPYVGEYLIPVYHYRNNTSVPVLAVAHGDTTDDYLSGHKDNFNTFVVGANEETTKRGQKFRILKEGNKSTPEFTLKCSIYLDNFDGDASWESDSDNNVYEKSFWTETPLSGYFIEPNSDYRENTDVVSSFMIENQTGYDITNSEKITPVLTITYTQNGETKSITTHYMSLVCPKLDKNMLWFKWHVPEGLNGKVSFSLELDPDKSFIDLDDWDNPKVTGTWKIDKVLIAQTPDTAYADNPPSWFKSNTVKLNTAKSLYTDKIWNSKSWTIYKQDSSGSFYKQTYGLDVPDSFISRLDPVDSKSAIYKNNVWYEKSGYGFKLTTSVNAVTASSGVEDGDYTRIQNVYAIFPELMYDTKVGRSSSCYFNGDRYGFKQPDWDRIEKNDKSYLGIYKGTFGTISALVSNSKFKGGSSTNYCFTLPVDTAINKFTHYIPIWYPDGSYIVKDYAYDAWCPAGMLSRYTDSTKIMVRGNMYSDYYVAGN